MGRTEKWDSHRTAAQDEDFAWLIDQGCSPEEAARRVGLSAETAERRIYRAREQEDVRG